MLTVIVSPVTALTVDGLKWIVELLQVTETVVDVAEADDANPTMAELANAIDPNPAATFEIMRMKRIPSIYERPEVGLPPAQRADAISERKISTSKWRFSLTPFRLAT